MIHMRMRKAFVNKVSMLVVEEGVRMGLELGSCGEVFIKYNV
jgi:hypothetical protein